MAFITATDEVAPAMTFSPVRTAFIVFTCALVALLEGWDIQAIGIAAPILVPSLHLDPALAGQVFGGGQAGLVAGSLIGGTLCDWWGWRNVLVVSALLFGLFTVATVLAYDYETLLAVRVCTGLGLGAAMPAMIGMALQIASPKNRVRTVTAMMAGMPLGGAFVSLFAAFGLAKLGWQSMFYMGGVIPLVLLPFIFALPNGRRPKTPGSRAENPFAALFGGRRAMTTLLLWAAYLLTLIVLYMMLNWLPSLMAKRGFTLEVAHTSSLVFNLVSVFGTLAMGLVVDRFGYKWPVPLCYIGLLAGVCGMAFTVDVQSLLISSGVIGFFLLGGDYALGGVSPMFYPQASRGLGTGAGIAAGRLGSIVGPMAAGYILQLGFGPAGVAIAMIPVIVTAGLCVFVLARRAEVHAN